MVDPRRIVVATTFENRPPYAAEVEILYRTLHAYGGDLARARRIACSVGPPDPFVAEVLDDLGVEVRTVAPFDARCPHANKLAMLELADDGDLVLALDTDVAIAGDPTPWLDGYSVQAKVVDNDPVGLTLWPELFAARGVELPTARYRTDYANRTTIPYFNSGVVAIPSPSCRTLHAEWGDAVRWLLDDGYDQLPPEFDRLRFFTDQFAFALALAALKLPVRALPLALNFPTHEPLHAASGADTCSPQLVHHHHRLERDGQLLRSQYAAPNSAIDRINEELARDPEQPPANAPAPRAGQAPFDNEAFWDERYATNPALGSGIGSRGEVAQRKLELLQGVVDDVRPASILDVGCGDLEIVRHLHHDAAYTGVDISSVVLERNVRVLPDATFLHGDFVTLAGEAGLQADLVLCLDVLIHQHDAAYYEQFVAALVHATRRVGIVAAYDAEPSGANASEITAWHGPITELLRTCGARDVQVVDSYRDTAVVRFRALA